MSESVMFELVDIKQEINSTVQHASLEQGSPDINNGKPDSVHSEQKQPDDIEFNFLQCDPKCETCQKYIRKLREHVRAIHGVGGQPLRDPIRLEIPDIHDATLSNLEIKREVEGAEAMDWESETEMMLESGETNESESDSDVSTARTQKSHCKKLKKRGRYSMEDPLKADTVENIDLECEKLKSSVSNQDSTTSKTRERIEKARESDDNIRHTVEKPFKMGQCGTRFPTKEYLLKKRDTVLKPFKCNECDKSFREMYSLDQHMKIHTGERPYKCDKCEKSFKRADALNQHKKRHTGKRSFQCNECERNYGRFCDLTRHKRTHT